jgi:hypothetical protein
MALATLPYSQRPNLQPSDFLIGQKQNESRYVPSSLVPIEISGEIFRDHAQIIFKYTTSENPSSKKFKHANVELDLGRSTQKILTVSLSFEPTHRSLISAIDEATKTIDLAKSLLSRPSIRKSYDLGIDFLRKAKRDFNTHMKRELEEMFRQKPAP